MRTSHGVLLGIWLACGCASSPPPGVVVPAPGQTLDSIPGPMPHFGPFTDMNDAITAACPVIMNQPHAVMPALLDNQNFDVYWRTSVEYCAWFYGVEGQRIEMSLLAMSSVQDDPRKRKCALPPNVADARYTAGSIAYLLIIHSHPLDYRILDDDLLFLAKMARVHGITPTFKGQTVSIGIVAYFAREVGGNVTCQGFYRYDPMPDSELVKVVIDERTGQWRKQLVGHVTWDENGNPSLVK